MRAMAFPRPKRWNTRIGWSEIPSPEPSRSVVAPGFTDTVEYSQAVTAPGLQAQNPNLVGGDISGGMTDMLGMLVRPVFSADAWATPAKGLYLASSSTPPGPAVHGMNGHLAALSALRREFGIRA